MENLNLATIAKHFCDEHEAWALVESIRWPEKPQCPHCNATDAYRLGTKTTRKGHPSPRRVWRCKGCRKDFTCLIDTIFEDTHIPLSKWLLGIHMMCAGKTGVFAHELHRQLGVTLKTAWFMAHRVRYAMARPPLRYKLTGTVEADETWAGGNVKGRGRAYRGNKTPVVSLVQRDGEARSCAVPTITGFDLGPILRENLDPSAILYTDENPGYRFYGRRQAAHCTVNHRQGEYARGVVHTNTVEGFFGQLKRSIDGAHHHVSPHHLNRYLTGFDFRYNTRQISDGQRTVATIRAAGGKRLRYREP